jgi:hypothetical protein
VTPPGGRKPAPCIPDTKIGAYLLNVDHPDGGPKAAFFLSRGFTIEDPRPFIAALLEHPIGDRFVDAEANAYVTKYIYEGPLPCPDGGSPRIRSVWKLIEDGLMMALVTAYPI